MAEEEVFITNIDKQATMKSASHCTNFDVRRRDPNSLQQIIGSHNHARLQIPDGDLPSSKQSLYIEAPNAPCRRGDDEFLWFPYFGTDLKVTMENAVWCLFSKQHELSNYIRHSIIYSNLFLEYHISASDSSPVYLYQFSFGSSTGNLHEEGVQDAKSNFSFVIPTDRTMRPSSTSETRI
eukprot:scaffold55810_cov49-Cyclotella_meneghiniana.AAC.1